MKRLFELVGLTYLSVLAVVFYFGKTSVFIVGSVALLLFVVFLAVKRFRKTRVAPILACVALFACLANLVCTELFYEKTVEKYDGYSGVVTATMIEEPVDSGGYYRYCFKTKSIGEEKKKVKFVVYHNELLDIEPFDIIDAELELSGNTSERDLSKRFFLRGNMGYESPSFTVVGQKKSVYRYAIMLRQSIRRFLSSKLTDESFPLCSALLIGDKFLLSDEVREDFTKAGASHIIVVSGMHFSILASGFIMLANMRYRHRHIYSALAFIFILIYMSITGYSPSVLRSGIMLILCCLGIAISRDPYMGNSLGFAAMVVTFWNPYCVGDIGLILSFASTYAILYIAPYLKEKFYKRIKFFKTGNCSSFKKILVANANKIIRVIISVLCMNISATLVSIPLSILFFGSLSTVSVLSTLALYFPIQWLLILTLVFVVLGFIPFLAPAFCVLIELLSRLSLVIVEFFADLSFSYLYVKHSYVYLWVFMCVVLLAFMLCSESKKRVRVYALSCVMVFVSGYLSMMLLTYSQSNLYVYDVGDGVAVMYSDEDVNAVLSLECNRSDTYSVVNSLQRCVGDIDFCASVCNTKNGINSVFALSKVFAISDILLYDTKRTVAFSNTSRVTQCSGNVAVNLSDEATAYYFMVNDDYVVYLDSVNGSVLILPFSVDVEEIDERYRSADIIVARCCPENFELLSCDTLVISSDSDYAYQTMSAMGGVSDRILLTAESDIDIKMEV